MNSDALTVRIAEIPVTLMCDPATRARLAERYAAFLVPHDPRALAIQIRQESGGAYIPLAISNVWQIRTAERNGRIDFESHYERGWVNRQTREGELVMRPQGDPENFLRVVYAWLGLDQSGLLLHAAGVISEGKGYAFFGPSGSGKTTVAGLSLDRTVLSDDLVMIAKRGEKFHLYGVPFRGDFPQAPRVNALAELRGVFALVQDAEHRLAPLALPEAVARISACVPFIMAKVENTRRVMEIAAELAAQVPVRALHFRRDAGFWEVVGGL